MPQPTVISANEVTTIGPNRTQVRQVLLKYKVGNQGPFTLVATPDEIANGTAANKMQAFANSLSTLPGLQGT